VWAGLTMEVTAAAYAYRLHGVMGSGTAFYEYDFSDSWLHRLELVSQRPVDEGRPPRGSSMVPAGVAGRFRRIVGVRRDPGGSGRPNDPDHAECSAWVAEIIGSDDPFDASFVDVPAVNRTLSELLTQCDTGGNRHREPVGQPVLVKASAAAGPPARSLSE
jgi:hypothetical protein